MTISIDGWQVPGFNIKVNADIEMPNQDLSGLGSFTLSSESGVKPCYLSVSTKIPFTKADQLAELITKAKALDENGARIIRTVTSAVATAYKIRKAKFDGHVKTSEDEQLKMWLVTFKLIEVTSKSEREQQQLDGQALENINSQANDGHANIQKQFENVEGP